MAVKNRIPFRVNQTVVAPYSLRRREHAPISTPLSWSEVRADLTPARFTIGNVHKRLRQPDPWEAFFNSRQSLKTAARLLQKI